MSSPAMAGPPAWAQRLVLGLLPKGVTGQSIAGDLIEEYNQVVREQGIERADRWYCRTALALITRYRWSRHRPIKTLPKRSRQRRKKMNDWLQDMRWGWRRLRRSPVFTATIILTLALGIGANTTIFSVVNTVLLQPLPYPEPQQLVTLSHVYPSVDLVTGVSAPGFRDYRDRTRSFAGVAIAQSWGANLTGFGQAARISGSRVSAGYFETYDIAPMFGRSFQAHEDTPGNQYVAVISHGFWQQRLGGAKDVLQQSLVLDDENYQIIGVMPSGFEDFFDDQRELWIPIALEPDAFTDQYRIRESQAALARVQSGVSVATAADEMTELAETIKAELPGTYPEGWTVRVTSLDEVAKRGYRTALLVLLGAVGFVLLITCANVANLLLVRGVERRKELAIRKALGAAHGQVIRQLLSESMILSTLGGIAGLLLAAWGIRLVVLIGPEALAAAEIAIDSRVLLFTLGVSLLAGILFGLAPALQSAGRDIQSALREGGRSARSDHSGTRLRRLLIIGEVALALILLTGSGLMIRSIAQLRQVDPGFSSDHLLTANLRISPVRYPDREAMVGFFDQLLHELQAAPGIESAGITSVLPFGGGWGTSVFNVEGYLPDESNPPPWGDIRIVSPEYAQALGLPLQEGRFFDYSDAPDTSWVGVIDELMARRFWPQQSAIGRRVTFDDPESEDARWITIVGVVGHTLHAGLDDGPRIQLYLSSRQFGLSAATLVIRTAIAPVAATSLVRQAVLAVDPEQPIAQVRVMEELITESIGSRKLLMLLLTLFSGLAILLAALGIYGIMAHMVREHARELGIRMALGATRIMLFNLVIKRGLSLAAIGLVVGLGGSLALTRLLQSQLFEIDPYDPLTLIAVAGVLLVVALLAVCIPANRAARVDPVANLKA